MQDSGSPEQDHEADSGIEVAIVGMAGRFPGAGDIDAFWRNVADGVCSIKQMDEAALRAVGYDEKTLRDPSLVRVAALLDDAHSFDSGFFGFSPAEAAITDPQHRILLECSWKALEDAGYGADGRRGVVGVFAGCGPTAHLIDAVRRGARLHEPMTVPDPNIVGTEKDFLATRVAHRLNLTGPAITIQTACSTSLVAVHLACESLLTLQCDVALAGGVALHGMHAYLHTEGGITTPDGQCRPFDAAANGILFGDGAGVVVLKRLADAIEDRDNIRAVILGSAINNDGGQKVSYWAPSVQGQSQVIAQAVSMAGVESSSIQYIETHGTGTNLGDPIEVAALGEAYGTDAAQEQSCALGAVKANIGHLDTAAGVVGLIKAALCLEHRVIPPLCGFETPNPLLNLEGTPFFIPTEKADWARQNGPRRAAVSSFGFGGTNAHVIVQEAPPVRSGSSHRPDSLMLVSAKSPPALDEVCRNLASHIETFPEVDLADIAYTSQVGRERMPFRRLLVGSQRDEIVNTLRAEVSPEIRRPRSAPTVVFAFPGQAAQRVGMGEKLRATEPVFREIHDRCADLLKPLMGLDIREVLYPDPTHAAQAAQTLSTMRVAQPAVFSFEYALAMTLMQWGVRPDLMVGHSLGEYVAATLAGVFSLEDALGVVHQRGCLMEETDAGAMLAVRLPEGEVRERLQDGLTVAVINEPGSCVVSGVTGAVDALEAELEEEDVSVVRLDVQCASHSALMDSIVPRFEAVVAGVPRNPPKIPWVSSRLAAVIEPSQATDSTYWGRHLREPVRFGEAVGRVFEDSSVCLIEVGPGSALGGFASRHPDCGPSHTVVSTQEGVTKGVPDDRAVTEAVGRLWQAGVEIDWDEYHRSGSARRVSMPTYPFQRRDYSRPSLPTNLLTTGDGLSFEKRPDVRKWLYAPSWSQAPVGPWFDHASIDGRRFLLFDDGSEWTQRLIHRLSELGGSCRSIRLAGHSSDSDCSEYSVNPAEAQSCHSLFEQLKGSDWWPDCLLHTWSLGQTFVEGSESTRAHQLGVGSLVCLTSALSALSPDERPQVIVITHGIADLPSAASIVPANAALVGMARAASRELGGTAMSVYDVEVTDAGPVTRIEPVVAEIARPPVRDVVAWRWSHRWNEDVVPYGAGGEIEPVWRDGGTYVVTGAFGTVGRALAMEIAKRKRVRLGLIGRSPLPSREDWDGIVATTSPDDPMAVHIAHVRALEEAGASVCIAAADVCDSAGMAEALAKFRAEHGELNGVIHTAISPRVRLLSEVAPGDAIDWVQALSAGTRALLSALAPDRPEFVVFCSSLVSRFGPVGLGELSAVCAALDAEASRAREVEGLPVTSILWDGWRLDEGLAAKWKKRHRGHWEVGMHPAEAVDALELCIASDEGRMLISTRSFELLSGMGGPPSPVGPVADGDGDEAQESQAAAEDETAADDEADRGHLAGVAYVEPETDAQKTIAGIMTRILGVESPGLHDDFLLMGGDSLQATRAARLISRSFEIEFPVRVFLTNGTIAKVAEFVEEAVIDQLLAGDDEPES